MSQRPRRDPRADCWLHPHNAFDILLRHGILQASAAASRDPPRRIVRPGGNATKHARQLSAPERPVDRRKRRCPGQLSRDRTRRPACDRLEGSRSRSCASMAARARWKSLQRIGTPRRCRQHGRASTTLWHQRRVGGDSASRTTFLVIDDSTFRPGNEGLMKRSIEEFLDILPPTDRVALMTTPLASVRTGATTATEVRQALERVTARIQCQPRVQTPRRRPPAARGKPSNRCAGFLVEPCRRDDVANRHLLFDRDLGNDSDDRQARHIAVRSLDRFVSRRRDRRRRRRACTCTSCRPISTLRHETTASTISPASPAPRS